MNYIPMKYVDLFRIDNGHLQKYLGDGIWRTIRVSNPEDTAWVEWNNNHYNRRRQLMKKGVQNG